MVAVTDLPEKALYVVQLAFAPYLVTRRVRPEIEAWVP